MCRWVGNGLDSADGAEETRNKQATINNNYLIFLKTISALTLKFAVTTACVNVILFLCCCDFVCTNIKFCVKTSFLDVKPRYLFI